MEITLEVSIAEIEMANFLLALAYREAKSSPTIQQTHNITPAALDKAEDFRDKLVEQYLSTSQKLNVCVA